MTTDTKPEVTREQVLAMIDIALLAVQHPHELDAVIYPAAEVACLLAIETGAPDEVWYPLETVARGENIFETYDHPEVLLRMAREKLLAWERED